MQPQLFLHLQSPHQCCMSLSRSLSSLPSTLIFTGRVRFVFVLRGCRTSHSARCSGCPLAPRSSSSVEPPPSSSGVTGCFVPDCGRSGSLIVLLTVHLSDKTEERERPPASLSFNGQPRNEGEAIKAGAEPESLFNVCDHPDRIINQELKEFKTFALGFLT